ncbi:hypothetical protein E1193_15970 [Micromonospora sp. KC606]|uniref:hypothetical protein n=1 Tax=Micromonospora sp. KC606 TaxID=2530379 RepID=UPI00104DDDB4|nr:hypothetical protein [Micromonospora sp. KC606]TDC81022.1 hypothetical protein E1193_15970 [Micromonospora sp. KC606]
MTTEPSLPARLAVSGERLGWTFIDRDRYWRRFPEQAPELGEVPAELHRRVEMAESDGRRALRVGGIGIVLALIVGVCGAQMVDDDSQGAVGVLAVLLLIGGVGLAGWLGHQPMGARQAVRSAEEQLRREYADAYADWDQRRVWFDENQQEAVDAMPEWSAVAPTAGNRRVDIVGGSTYGWEALLTVFGGSLLATRGRMTLVDFTGEALCGELIELARATGRSVAELTRFDPTGGLELDELVACLVDAMYGDAPGASRADRSQDTLLLTEVCGVLSPELTVARLLAAVRVLLDRPAQDALTPAETDRLLDLRTDESRRHLQGRLHRIEAFVHPLEHVGGDPAPPVDADLTCLIFGDDPHSARRELLKDLLVRSLTRQIRRDPAGLGSLILIGADEVDHRVLEQLGTLCERGGIRLVLLFAHLRDESLRLVGGGEVAFMRLGNHREAAQAADFIGKGHRFVLSQLTRTLGGNETHTEAETTGAAATDTTTTSTSTTARIGHGSSTRSGSASFTRSWNRTESLARGSNWSDAEAAQRVYEYAVEPRVLQDLPDYALIMVQRDDGEPVVRAVEVNPEIVMLPRMSMEPVALPPLPGPDEALHPIEEQVRPGS